MCAIAGSSDPYEVSKMLRVMEHRAPDGRKIITTNGYTIGMGRLAIIDLESPDLFPFGDDNLLLTFNGEIYNYAEIRQEYHFKCRSKSDTEVLYQLYRQCGIDCLDSLNGMFAFAFYEPKARRLFLARDIAGEKPLYYRITPKDFKFASEAKALNWDCVELPAGHALTYDFTHKEVKVWQWWQPRLYPFDPRKTREQELEELLDHSVHLRTRADVPYGLYYSGGIDSSLISTFHKFNKYFSYVDSLSYKDDFKKNLKKIVWHLDYPVQSFSAYALWRLAREASQSVKVVISGEGADELFGGYVRYIQPHFNALAQQKFPSYKGMFAPAEDVNAAGMREFNGNLKELLRMGDRMASAWGIENRCPFLDRRIIEFAFSLPSEEKIDGLTTKKILRKVLAKRFPAYQDFEKAGLFCQVNEWLGAKERSYDKTLWLETQKKIWESLQKK